MSNDTKQASDGQTVTVPELGNVDDMTDALSLSMPEAVEADENFNMEGFETVEPKTPEAPKSAETDKSGETFDPDIHRADADGNPVEQENLAADAAQGINMGLETGSMDTAAMSQLSKEFGGGHSVASGAS